jgi:hypothetical protein
VIASISSDPDLARFYEIDWQIIPNMIMDLTVPPLTRVMTVYYAGQIFLVVTLAFIMSGALALNRALFGRPSPLPLVAFPLLYNYIFLTGLTNYIFGIGLSRWALACWIWLREHPCPFVSQFPLCSSVLLSSFRSRDLRRGSPCDRIVAALVAAQRTADLAFIGVRRDRNSVFGRHSTAV